MRCRWDRLRTGGKSCEANVVLNVEVLILADKGVE
jgi:hypothetical protein